MIIWSLDLCIEKLTEYKKRREEIKQEIMARTGWNGGRSTAPKEYKEAVAEVNVLIKNVSSALWGRGKSSKIVGPRSKSTGRVKAKNCLANRNRLIKKRAAIKKELMDKFNWGGGKRDAPVEYRDRVWKITRKISKYDDVIRNINKEKAKMDNLARKVEEFTSSSLKQSVIKRVNPHLVHGLFLKYGMEHNMKGTLLCSYMGIKTTTNQSVPTIVRNNFTRSFSTNPSNRELYYRFKQFVQEPD